jgi:LPXTG-motif cell wall-anchored protein
VARQHRIAALLAGLSLAVVPAAAHAQNGAGDEQYQDPFGGGQTQTAPKAQQPSAPLSQAPPVTPAPATPAPQAARTATAAPTAQGQLPRTGLDVRLLAAAGLVLLLAGLVLRLRLRPGDGSR